MNRLENHKIGILQKCIFLLTALLVFLPLFVSLTVRPWVAANSITGEVGYISYLTAGQYWSRLVYFLGAAMTVCMIFGGISRYLFHLREHFNKKNWVSAHWLSLHMLLLLSCSVISSLLAKDRRSAFLGDWYCHEGLILYVFYGAFFLCGSWLSRKQMKWIAEAFTAVGAVTGVLMITRGRLLPGLFYMENPYALMFHQYNHYGYFLSICVPLVMGLCLQDNGKSPVFKIARLAELWLLFNAMAVNSVRGSFAAVLLVLIAFNLYVFTVNQSLKGRILFLDVLFLSTIFFFNTGSLLADRLLDLFQSLLQFGRASGAEKQAAAEHLGTGRGMLWKYGLQFALEKPAFGYGPGNLMEPYEALGSHTSSPHNDLILIAASLGIPAVLAYLSGILGHMVFFIRNIRRLSGLEVTIAAGVLGYLLSSMVGVSIYYTACYYFLFLGFSYGILRDRLSY